MLVISWRFQCENSKFNLKWNICSIIQMYQIILCQVNFKFHSYRIPKWRQRKAIVRGEKHSCYIFRNELEIIPKGIIYRKQNLKRNAKRCQNWLKHAALTAPKFRGCLPEPVHDALFSSTNRSGYQYSVNEWRKKKTGKNLLALLPFPRPA